MFDDAAYQYDLDSLSGFEPEDVTRRRISNMKAHKIQRLLDAAPTCPVGNEQGLRDWWARWMPISAGRQLWPDGNHRVGMMVAEVVARQAGFTIVLDEDDVEEMRRASKKIVVDRWRRAPRVTEEEFTDPDHPLCRYYEAFKPRLRLERLSGQSPEE